jgi:drug/metabolite transporter (DMT)-like permease
MAAEPPPSGAARASQQPLGGILLMLSAMALLPIYNGTAKYLSVDYPVAQVVWARYFFHLAVLLPLVLWRYGARVLVPPRFRLQLLRGTLLVADTFLFFAALALIPLADTLALTFVAPLILTALSALALGEQVGLRRWSAVAVGFVGTLIIVRPGFAAFEPGALLAVGAGMAYAVYQLLTRKLAGSAPPLVTLGYTALVGTLVMTAALPAYWVTPSLVDFALMVGMGATAAVAHFLIISAFERAQASLLAPFNYCEMIGAVTIGYLVFGDFPDSWTWLGVLILVASGIYISWRERRVRAAPRGPATHP